MINPKSSTTKNISSMNKLLTIALICLFSQKIMPQSFCDSVICRNDNDYCTYFDTISNKKSLLLNVCLFFNKQYPKTIYQIIQIFEIKFDSLRLYVVKNDRLPIIGQNEEYHFWVYDPKHKKISNSPFVINGHWMSNQEEGFDVKLLSSPLVNYENGYLWVKERRHNGNSYNAVIRYKLKCDKNLNLKIMQCIEEVSLCFFPNMEINDQAFVYREQITEYKFVSTIMIDGEKSCIGSFCLSKNGKAYDIIVNNEKYDYLIFTSSGIQSRFFKAFLQKKDGTGKCIKLSEI